MPCFYLPVSQGAPQTETAADVKARIKAITEDDAAKGNESLAKHLAFDTDLPADDAIAALKASAPAASNVEKVEDRKGYQARRSAASDLAQPSGSGQEKPKATINTGGIYASRIVKKGV
jgi:ATP-dependent Clp protease protease subunit